VFQKTSNEYSTVTVSNIESNNRCNKRKKTKFSDLDSIKEIPLSLNKSILKMMQNNASKEHSTMYITNLFLSHNIYLAPGKIDYTSFYSCLDEQLEIQFPNDARTLLTQFCESRQYNNFFI